MSKNFCKPPGLGLPLWLATGVLAGLASAPAGSQQALQPTDLVAQPEEEPVRRYAVEVIVFEYNGDDAGTELFVPKEPPAEAAMEGLVPGDEIPTFSDTGMPPADMRDDRSLTAPEMPAAEISAPDGTADELRPLSPEEMILSELPSNAAINLKVMEPEEYTLDEIYTKLDELGAYTPLLRTGWIQDTVEENEARALRLRRLGNPPLRLDGELKLYLGRYLHLVVNLTLEDTVEQPPLVADVADNAGSQGALEFDPYVSASFIPVRYEIDEDRIVRNGELRYFDHPRFGMLARVTRIEEARTPEEPLPIDGNAVGSTQRDF